LELPVFGAQHAIQFFDKGQELLPILFDYDQRAQFMNAITILLVHRNGSITVPAIFGMFDVEQYRILVLAPGSNPC
jgi:hypothetical protein